MATGVMVGSIGVVGAAPATAAGSCAVEGGHVVTVLLDGGVSRLTSEGDSVMLGSSDCGTGDIVSIFAGNDKADTVVIDASAPWLDGADAMKVFLINLEPTDSVRVITTIEYDLVEMCTNSDGTFELTSSNEEAMLLDLAADSSASTPVRVDLAPGPDTFVHHRCHSGSPSARPISVHGGLGPDDITGGVGNQRIYGNEGRDTLRGGPGNDMLHGGRAADRLDGGSGTDTCGCEAVDSVVRIP